MSKAREISELGDVVAVDGSNVGIGTSSPIAQLEASEGFTARGIAVPTNTSVGSVQLGFDGTNGVLRTWNSSPISYETYGVHKFLTSGTERMRIDASGRVGIGTSSPSNALHLANTSGPYVVFQDNDAGSNQPSIGTEGTAGSLIYNSGGTSASHIFKLNRGASEAARIDASGNLLVGTTVANPIVSNIAGLKYFAATGTLMSSAVNVAPLELGRNSSDGAIANFYKNGTTVGSIGVAAGDNLYLQGSSGHAGLESTNLGLNPWEGGSTKDNLYDLGGSAARWDDIYATNGTIQTSDANEKQQIAELTAAEMQAAKAISKLFKTFKWNDSVAEKGDDARIHTGVIAQEVEAAMTAAGLDAGRYAFFISTTWWESTEVIPAVEAVAAVEATYDEEGNILTEAVEAVEAQPERTVTHTYDTAEEAPAGAVERTRKGIRYPQLLAFIGAATEQRLASIEARLDALETV